MRTISPHDTIQPAAQKPLPCGRLIEPPLQERVRYVVIHIIPLLLRKVDVHILFERSPVLHLVSPSLTAKKRLTNRENYPMIDGVKTCE